MSLRMMYSVEQYQSIVAHMANSYMAAAVRYVFKFVFVVAVGATAAYMVACLWYNHMLGAIWWVLGLVVFAIGLVFVLNTIVNRLRECMVQYTAWVARLLDEQQIQELTLLGQDKDVRVDLAKDDDALPMVIPDD